MLITKRLRLKRAIKRLGPIGYWPLNEGDGTTAINNAPANPSSLNGATTGATVAQPGLVGKA